MQVLPAKRQENCARKYLEGIKNQNGEYLVNLCEPNSLETQFIFSIVN